MSYYGYGSPTAPYYPALAQDLKVAENQQEYYVRTAPPDPFLSYLRSARSNRIRPSMHTLRSQVLPTSGPTTGRRTPLRMARNFWNRRIACRTQALVGSKRPIRPRILRRRMFERGVFPI